MKNKTKNFLRQITTDTLPSSFCQVGDLENGKSMNEGIGIITTNNRKSIKGLIGLAFSRRRKNFSVILFVGLSALLCALYYTSYYPGSGSVWTLRFGITTFTRDKGGGSSTTSALDDRQIRALPLGIMGSAANGRQELNHLNLADGERNVGKIERKNSAFDGGESRRIGNNKEFDSESLMTIGSVNKYGESNGDDEVGRKASNDNDVDVKGERRGGESIQKTWDWKYWASLNYWIFDFSGGNGSKDDEFLFKSHSEKSAENHKLSSSGKNLEKRLSCNFPRLKPFDPSITEFLKMPPTIDCQKSYPLVFRTSFRNKLIQHDHPFSYSYTTTTSFPTSSQEEEVAVDEPEIGKSREDKENFLEGRKTLKPNNGNNNYTCCYKTIMRGNGSDHNIIYSKRCYPIPLPETEIPSTHEFISVRCKVVPSILDDVIYHQKLSQSQKLSQVFSFSSSPKKYYLKTAQSITPNGPNNANGNEIASSLKIKYFKTNRTKVKMYKDMFAFVPLKPKVENRIREYEESKRKLLYNNKRHQIKSESDKFNESNKNHDDNHHTESPSTKDEDRLSMIILGLDAQSHMNFIRQMPLSYNFLTKNLSAIGLHGYTKIGDNTFPNVVTLLSGLTVDELNSTCWPTKDSYFDDCPFIWKNYSESGYRTSLAEDSVWMGTFNYEKKGFMKPPTDYYLNPMSLLMSKKIGHETWANAKLCYGPRLAFEVLLEYIVKTAVTFTDGLYFQFVWANSLFHDYLNNPRIGDELLYLTLKYLLNKGYLNKTAFILLSDHGIRWGSIRSTYQGKIEERMPMAYFYFPERFHNKYQLAIRNLRRNAWKLTTPFDVHETLKDILKLSRGENLRFDRWSENDYDESNKFGERSESVSESSDKLPPRGISLFRPVPLQRTCKMAGIEEHWCVCNSMQNVPINSTLVRSGARFIVKVINGLVLGKHKESCAKLKLLKINEAKRKIDGDVDKGLDIELLQDKFDNKNAKNISSGENGESKSNTVKDFVTSSSTVSLPKDITKSIQLQIVIVTTPGHAVFEATIYGEAGLPGRVVKDEMQTDIKTKDRNFLWKLSGDISRLNLYGEQSACVDDYTVQKYCYCHNLDNVN